MRQQLIEGNCLTVFVLPSLAADSAQAVITSPPYYGLRDYGIPEQFGLEPNVEAYVANLVAVFNEVWRVLKLDGTLWLNLGDSYAGSGKGGQTGQARKMRSQNWQPQYALQGHAAKGLSPILVFSRLNHVLRLLLCSYSESIGKPEPPESQ